MSKKEFILELFSDSMSDVISVHSLYKKALKSGYKGTMETFRVWIYLLTKEGLLKRVRTGMYAKNINKEIYKIPIDHFMRRISVLLNKKYKSIKYDIWNISILNEFTRYTFNKSFYVLDVEFEIKEFVFEFLQEKSIEIFMDISENDVYKYLFSNKKTLLLLPLVSESPITQVDNVYVPYLEKIMVDVVSEEKLNTIVEDINDVYKNIYDKYMINERRLFRYARRRNKEEKIKNILRKSNSYDR